MIKSSATTLERPTAFDSNLRQSVLVRVPGCRISNNPGCSNSPGARPGVKFAHCQGPCSLASPPGARPAGRMPGGVFMYLCLRTGPATAAATLAHCPHISTSASDRPSLPAALGHTTTPNAGAHTPGVKTARAALRGGHMCGWHEQARAGTHHSHPYIHHRRQIISLPASHGPSPGNERQGRREPWGPPAVDGWQRSRQTSMAEHTQRARLLQAHFLHTRSAVCAESSGLIVCAHNPVLAG